MVKYVWIVLLGLSACQSEESKSVAPQLNTSNTTESVSTQDVKKVDAPKMKPTDITPQASQALIGDLSEPLLANVEHGKKLTKSKCLMCHFTDKNKRKVGPSLQGVYGRAPTIQGVPFTVWNDDALNQWLINPRAVKANTRMGFPGFKKAQDRLDVIAYLKIL